MGNFLLFFQIYFHLVFFRYPRTPLYHLMYIFQRTGLDTEQQFNTISSLVSAIYASLDVFEFRGIYNHCGDTYSSSDIEITNKQSVRKLVTLVEKIKAIEVLGSIVKVPVVGTGSTPGCCHPIDEYKLLNELHPGNYSLMDAFQVSVGSCEESDVACHILSRIITVFPTYAVMDAGFLAVSKDSPELNFGTVVSPNTDLYIAGMSQEAGKLKLKTGKNRDMTTMFNVDDLVKILPAHSCHTAAFHPMYHLVRTVGNQSEVLKTITPCRGW